jgi:hypothetical protein
MAASEKIRLTCRTEIQNVPFFRSVLVVNISHAPGGKSFSSGSAGLAGISPARISQIQAQIEQGKVNERMAEVLRYYKLKD